MIIRQRATVQRNLTIPELRPQPGRTGTHRSLSASRGALAGWQETRPQDPAISADAEAPDRTSIRILSVDNDPLFREEIATIINQEPDMMLVSQASSLQEAIQQYREHQPDITLMEISLPDLGGVDALLAIRAEFPAARVLILTTCDGEVEMQRALEAGASGYLLKRTPPSELLQEIRKVHFGEDTPATREAEVLNLVAGGTRNGDIGARLSNAEETGKVHLKHIRAKGENIELRDEVDRASMFEDIVGTSSRLKAVLSLIGKVAPTDSTVFITGETGTGKELIARAIHKRSPRSERAFVSVNCAALAPSLISSELFGHEKGAFTGATQRRLGRFEVANGGTIFLDEIGELLPDTQVALLRVLQEREFERVGGGRTVQVDVRVITATNRDLKAAVANRTFREDLFYRLNVFPIEAPPLRDRKDDLFMLLEYFVQRYASRMGKNIRSVEKKTLDLLQSYDWPGNVRELQNVIERSMILSSGDVFLVDELWLSKEGSRPASRTKAFVPFKDAPGGA
jgi:DNA-binding NtrC family response regulator